MSLRKIGLRSLLEGPYEIESDLNDFGYRSRGRDFHSELEKLQTRSAFRIIAPDISQFRPSHQPMTEPRDTIIARGPRMDDMATFLEQASNVGLELNASKTVLVMTSVVAVFAFLVAGPVYGLLASLPAVIAALSYRVLTALSKRLKP